MMDLKWLLAQPHVLAQVEGAETTPLWPLILIVALIAAIVFFVLLRKKPEDDEKEARPRAEEGTRPTRDLLEDRPEVDAPVEIHEGMSLAEIKRAKRSRVVGGKARRETAAEATEKARREHEETARAKGTEQDEPVVEEPVAEEPVKEEPVKEEPVAEEPGNEEPVKEEQSAAEKEEAPQTKAGGLKMALPRPTLPKSDGEASKKPALKLPKPGAGPVKAVEQEESQVKEPAIEEPSIEDSSSVAPVLEPPAEEEPVKEEPVKEEPVKEEPVKEEPVKEEPVKEEPVKEEPVKEEPVKEEPVVEKPAAAPATVKKAPVSAARDESKSLRDGLEKTRSGFVDRLGNLFKRESLDQDLLDEVEEILYTADVGTKIADHIIKAVETQLSSADKTDPGAVWEFIREYCEEILSKHQEPIDYEAGPPFVMLVIGVNGVGKTTTIGKLASKLKREGKSVLLVAGDTFRAAAVDQLGIWAERTAIPLYSGEDSADPASVIYGGIERGVKEGFDVVICDTAGRLHTKSNLLDELKKIGRVAGKALDGAPHETVLVLDANTGQNAIAQANLFKEALDITGIVLTKLDGTAKGGVILGICDEIAAPVRYIGIGEGVDDLRPFDAQEFVEALFM